MVMPVTKLKLWCVLILVIMVLEGESLNGPNVCMVQQKYNITKRVKYRAPMSVRTYEWCFSMPPRCSKWKTEIRELTKLETDEREAEVAVCCPGYKMKDVSCVPICPNGKTGHRCSDDCSINKWGPNCVNDCEPCNSGTCSPITGVCSCQDGWQGESCEIRMLPTTSTTTKAENLLTISATKSTPPITPTISFTRTASAITPLLITTTPRTKSLDITRLNRLEPILEISTLSSNRTDTMVTPSVLNRTSLLETSSLAPIRTTSSTVTTTTDLTTAIRTTTSPITTSVTKTSTTLKVDPVTTTVELPKVIITTTLATESATTTTEPTTLILANENKTTEETNIASKKDAASTNIQKTINIEVTNRIEQTRTSLENITKPQNYFTITTNGTTEMMEPIEQTTVKMLTTSKYNRTEVPQTNIKELHIPVHIRTETKDIIKTSTNFSTKKTLNATTPKEEPTKRPESTIRYFPTTVKFKPKEIWIRPAQKGEPYKSKSEANQEIHSKSRTTQPNTTPKTIIVSIIPTSVSYATFKKIALTTASLLFDKTKITAALSNETLEQEVTQPMLTTTDFPLSTKSSNKPQKYIITSISNKTKELHTFKSDAHIDRTTKTFSTFHTTREFSKNNTVSKVGTNSMITVDNNLNSSNLITTLSTNAIRTTQQNVTMETTTVEPNFATVEKVTRPIKIVTVKPRNVTIITVSGKNKNETVVKITKTIANDIEKTNATRIKDIIKTNQVTTESPDDEEFHILTEPEHITAVMEGKGKDHTSVDLISVISIAGGIMMAVITVAVIIVMVERCKRPRYDNVRKVSDIRMQVMIDNNDEPPPYVRSIFHTPLPEPPNSEKCHYQPISTLDRNLKQFMRPVVVQTISPIMLENFRGILECHYDHLPRRSHNFETINRHCSLAPSVTDVDELTCLRPCSAMDSTIEALKCEARLDVIDSTTSEPLYAEIPCWRPPSEHAIEIMNLNGEAVTEL